MCKVVKLVLIVFLSAYLSACDGASSLTENCEPTPYDEIGPFYRPGAPERSKVGSGYIVKGRVLSVKGCRSLGGSRIEFWLVNPEGEYDDAHRATVYADKWGYYTFESNRPTDYVGRLPHIHIMVHADGHQQLITQHYPDKETIEAEFNLVLEPMR